MGGSWASPRHLMRLFAFRRPLAEISPLHASKRSPPSVRLHLPSHLPCTLYSLIITWGRFPCNNRVHWCGGGVGYLHRFRNIHKDLSRAGLLRRLARGWTNGWMDGWQLFALSWITKATELVYGMLHQLVWLLSETSDSILLIPSSKAMPMSFAVLTVVMFSCYASTGSYEGLFYTSDQWPWLSFSYCFNWLQLSGSLTLFYTRSSKLGLIISKYRWESDKKMIFWNCKITKEVTELPNPSWSTYPRA